MFRIHVQKDTCSNDVFQRFVLVVCSENVFTYSECAFERYVQTMHSENVPGNLGGLSHMHFYVDDSPLRIIMQTCFPAQNSFLRYFLSMFVMSNHMIAHMFQ